MSAVDGGEKAIEAIEQAATGEPYRLVLLDWKMPGMTGIDVLARMRETGIQTPVIFFTVLSDQIYEEAALTSGAVDFVDEEDNRFVGGEGGEQWARKKEVFGEKDIFFLG